MTRDALVEHIRAVPFEPFRLTLSDGRTIDVTGPEWLIAGNGVSTLGYVDEGGNDRILRISNNLIVTLDVLAPATN